MIKDLLFTLNLLALLSAAVVVVVVLFSLMGLTFKSPVPTAIYSRTFLGP